MKARFSSWLRWPRAIFGMIDELLGMVEEALLSSAQRRAKGWYQVPEGGYRYWDGYEWVGQPVDRPPSSKLLRERIGGL